MLLSKNFDIEYERCCNLGTNPYMALEKDFLRFMLSDGASCALLENHPGEKGVSKLEKEAGLPHVVFHSLRHTSSTYKLKLNNGDIKATQGDTGHSQADMVMDLYSHILDEDRRVNAQKSSDKDRSSEHL